MKKIMNLLIILLCVITLSGCGNSNTIKVNRTIVLNINSEVTPNFTSNFGEGSYDEVNKRYTHNINYVKDLYIYMSYEGLKTETVYISTSEMDKEIVTKDVDFGKPLDVEVEITVEGTKTLEGLQISNSLTYSNLIVGKKNTFKFTLPSRSEDYNIKFTLPNFREFNINLNQEDLVSGSTKINAVAITNEQMYIGFTGNNYSYKIYSMTTNDLITSGNKWEDDNKVEYVLVNNNDSYYVETQDSDYQTAVHKINQGVDTIIDLGSNRNNNMFGYLYINTQNEWYNDSMMYDKTSKTLRTSHEIFGTLETTGLLLKNSQNKWFYMDSLLGKVLDRGNNWEYEYTLDYSDFVEVDLNVTRINTKTNEIISTGLESDIYLYKNTSAEFNDNTFTLTVYEIDEATVYIDLYTLENDKIDTIEYTVYPYFKGNVYSKTITYEGRTIPYQFPIFLEELVYDSINDKYTYPDQTIDTSVSYVQFKIIEEDGHINDLHTSYNPYIMDEESNVIMYIEIGGHIYFELVEGKQYTLNYNGKKYSFITTNNHIETGKILIVDEKAPIKMFKIPQDYTIEIEGYEGYGFTRNSAGLIEVPMSNSGWYYVTISNGYASIEDSIFAEENVSLYEFDAFYVLKGADIRSDYNTYYTATNLGSNGIEYVYLEKYSEASMISDNLRTNITKVSSYNSEEEYTISKNNFVYNEEIKAYYYDLESEFDHVITFKDHLSRSYSNWSQEYLYYYDYDLGNYKGYVNNNTTIEYEYYDYSDNEYKTVTYTITSSDAKYIDMKIDTSSNLYEFIVTEIN